jgi:SAM-dependent methyltransferase
MGLDYAKRWRKEGLKGWENVYELMSRCIYNALIPPMATRCKALELGCGDGENSIRIATDFESLVIVDMSLQFLEATKQRLVRNNVDTGQVMYVHEAVEDFHPATYDAPRMYDAIFAIHILEHLVDPVAILATYKEYLAPGGEILIAVPNAYSLHRQLGVAMGLLEVESALNEQDRLLGHRRVYTVSLLLEHLEQAGLYEHYMVGSFIKPLSARQMNNWGPDVLNGLGFMGSSNYQIAADLCVCARKKKTARRPKEVIDDGAVC